MLKSVFIFFYKNSYYDYFYKKIFCNKEIKGIKFNVKNEVKGECY